jgi:hypothetical protein
VGLEERFNPDDLFDFGKFPFLELLPAKVNGLDLNRKKLTLEFKDFDKQPSNNLSSIWFVKIW